MNDATYMALLCVPLLILAFVSIAFSSGGSDMFEAFSPAVILENSLLQGTYFSNDHYLSSIYSKDTN